MKFRIVSRLNQKPGEHVLDFDSGTGTLSMMIKKASSGTIITGVDIDPQVLDIAQRKALRENSYIRLEYIPAY